MSWAPYRVRLGESSLHLIMPWQPRVKEGQRRRLARRLDVELHEAAQTTPTLPQGRSKEKSSNHPSRLRQKTITQAGTKGSQGLSPSGHLPQQPSLHQSPLPANPLPLTVLFAPFTPQIHHLILTLFQAFLSATPLFPAPAPAPPSMP